MEQQIKVLNSNQLKVIAIVAMFFDHFATIFLSHNILLGIILKTTGRITAPIMCYFIAEGYHNTSNRKKYILRLLIFALVSHLPYNMAFGYSFFQATSVIWPLALGLIALVVVRGEEIQCHYACRLFVVGLCCVLAITADWNFVAVLWIVMFGVFYGNLRNQIIGFCVIGVTLHLIPTFIRFGPPHDGYPHWFQLGIFLAIPFLMAYNGRRGKKSKAMTWMFYVFYPAHLFLFFLLDKLTPLASILSQLF